MAESLERKQPKSLRKYKALLPSMADSRNKQSPECASECCCHEAAARECTYSCCSCWQYQLLCYAECYCSSAKLGEIVCRVSYITGKHLALGTLGPCLLHNLGGLSSTLGLGGLLCLLVSLALLHALLHLTAHQAIMNMWLQFAVREDTC